MRYLLGLALSLSILFGGPALAAAVEDDLIDEVVVTNSSREVLLYFHLRDFLTPEMEKGVKSGLPLTLTFWVELHRQRPGWRDQKLADLEFRHILNYDSLKDEYRLVREEAARREVTSSSLAGARQQLGRINGLAILPLTELTPDHTYTLRIKARLAEQNRPPLWNRLLPFRRLWSFETDWHSVEFHY